MTTKKDLLELVSDLRGSADCTEVPVLLEDAADALEACIKALERAGVLDAEGVMDAESAKQ